MDLIECVDESLQPYSEQTRELNRMGSDLLQPSVVNEVLLSLVLLKF